jgi:hypothetical protein
VFNLIDRSNNLIYQLIKLNHFQAQYFKLRLKILILKINSSFLKILISFQLLIVFNLIDRLNNLINQLIKLIEINQEYFNFQIGKLNQFQA